MAQPRPRKDEPRLVQASRLEIIDKKGRIRAALGDTSDGAVHFDSFGLALYGLDGRRRAVLSIDKTGPTLVFDRNGNNALSMGVDDPTNDSEPAGPYVTIVDADGELILGLALNESGALRVKGQWARS